MRAINMNIYNQPAFDLAISEFDLSVAGTRLHVRRIVQRNREMAPGRPVLVFLHEALGSISLWRDFPEALAAGCGCDALVYDRPGSGRSAALTEERGLDYLHHQAQVVLPALLEACGIEQIIPVGHSDGGSIALLFAAAFPEKTARLITEAAHIYVEEITLEGIRAAVEAYHDPATELARKLRRHHREKTEALFAAWHRTWQSPAFRNWNIEACLPQIQAPLLAIQGAADEYATPAQLQTIVSQVGGPAEALLIPDCPHTPHRKARDIVLKAMTRFINTAFSHRATELTEKRQLKTDN